MKRQGVVALVAALVLIAAVVLIARRGRAPDTGGADATASARVFVSDSLGFRVRLPDSPGWTLRRDPPAPDGRVVSAVHQDEKAVVRVLALPAEPGTTLNAVFEARRKEFAATLGVTDLDAVLAEVLRDETRDINGRMFRQWQAITKPAAEAGGEPTNIVFMWLMTVDATRSLECIGLVRTPAQPTPEEGQAADALLRDIIYILQSFEVR
jgi:hypothetical protein